MTSYQVQALLKACAFIATISIISCAVTITTPTGGSGSATNSIAEGATSGAVMTVVATTDLGGATVNSFVVTSPTTQFEFATATSGALTVKSTATLDYETVTTQTVIFTASDGTTTSTGTLTVTITDVNDLAPTFTAKTFTVSSGSGADTAVGSVTATDADGTAPNNAISSYTITGGNTATMFKISSAGAITVNTGKTTSATTLPAYMIVIEAADNGASKMTGTTTVPIGVCSTSGAPVTSGSFITVAVMLMSFLYKFA